MCSMERKREGMVKARKNQTFFHASCKQMQPKWINGKSIHTPHEVDVDEAEKHLINKSMVCIRILVLKLFIYSFFKNVM